MSAKSLDRACKTSTTTGGSCTNDVRKELTDEQLNIAMCEARGWKKAPRKPWWTTLEEWWIGPKVTIQFSQLPSHVDPSNTSSLGNMHEAEKGMTGTEKYQYEEVLEEVCLNSTPPEHSTFATSRQRAIAWLRVRKPEVLG